jgi:uncharacterized membrane protein
MIVIDTRETFVGSVELIKFIHVMLGVTLLGILVASYFYNVISSRSSVSEAGPFILKLAIRVDTFIILPMIGILIATGALLTHLLKIPPRTPWILSAYLFMSIVTVLVMINWRLKANNAQRSLLFHLVSWLIFIGLCFIIHDAVMHATLLTGLWQ